MFDLKKISVDFLMYKNELDPIFSILPTFTYTIFTYSIFIHYMKNSPNIESRA